MQKEMFAPSEPCPPETWCVETPLALQHGPGLDYDHLLLFIKLKTHPRPRDTGPGAGGETSDQRGVMS